MDIPEFGELIGAQSGPHRVETATLKIDDPDSPLTRQFAASPLTAQLGGKGFVYTDEFYHFFPDGPYSRNKLHVLISIDAEKSDLSHGTCALIRTTEWFGSRAMVRAASSTARWDIRHALRDTRAGANDTECNPVRSGRFARGHNAQCDAS